MRWAPPRGFKVWPLGPPAYLADAGRVPVREGLQTGVTQANQELAKRVAEVKAAAKR